MEAKCADTLNVKSFLIYYDDFKFLCKFNTRSDNLLDSANVSIKRNVGDSIIIPLKKSNNGLYFVGLRVFCATMDIPLSIQNLIIKEIEAVRDKIAANKDYEVSKVIL